MTASQNNKDAPTASLMTSADLETLVVVLGPLARPAGIDWDGVMATMGTPTTNAAKMRFWRLCEKYKLYQGKAAETAPTPRKTRGRKRATELTADGGESSASSVEKGDVGVPATENSAKRRKSAMSFSAANLTNVA